MRHPRYVFNNKLYATFQSNTTFST